MIYFCMLLVLLPLSFVVQEFIPSIEWAYGASVMIVPTLFLCASVTVPYPLMLVYAFVAGLLWDARHLTIDASAGDSSSPNIDLPLGYTILIFGLCGSFMQGIRPLFRRGRFELPVIMVGVGILLWLLAEYLFIAFRRGSALFPVEFWMKLGTTSLFSLLLSPLLLFFLYALARWARFEISYDGIATRTYGR